MSIANRVMLGSLLLAPIVGHAQAAADTTIKFTFGGFIDAYYAYDIDRPPTIDRSFFGGALFTTQPARHDEFNVNLAYLETNISGKRLHGRFALQAGTSVQSNYNSEPTTGIVSGPSLSRMIQEAYAGYQLRPTVWIDAGIFYSNAGLEGWASKDNPTYTRSLVADYSPYYSSGVRAVWQATSKLVARLDVINGWQNISETNSEKGVGLRLDYTPNGNVAVSYYNLFNDEVGSGGQVGTRLRIFNGAGAKLTSGRTTLLGELDYGTLRPSSTGVNASNWWGYTAIAREQLVLGAAIVARVERYNDPRQVNIVTGLANPFQGNGASLGVDVSPQPGLMWRSELRGFFAASAVFPDAAGSIPRKTDGFLVSSLSLAF
ncbi:MAG TPA: porin [Gemmatimonadaceae bacterium]|jgi:hypothetical protein